MEIRRPHFRGQKIVHIVESGDNGVYHSAMGLGSQQEKFGYEVVYVTPAPLDTNGEKPPTMLWIPSMEGPTYRVMSLRKEDRPEIASVLDQALAGASVVHIHNPSPLTVLAARRARQLGIRVVFTFHTYYHQYTHFCRLWWKKGWKHLLISCVPTPCLQAITCLGVSYVCHQADVIVAPTPQAEEIIRDRRFYLVKASKKIVVCPTGIPVPGQGLIGPESVRTARRLLLEKGVPQEAKYQLYNGRISKEKGLHLVIQAFLRFNRNRENYLVIAGKGPELAKFQRTYRQHPDIIFLGHVSHDMSLSLCAGAELVVLGSCTDTQSLGVGEALSAGTRVLVTNQGGPQHFVVHGVTGWIMPPTIRKFCEAMEAAWNDRRSPAAIAWPCQGSMRQHAPDKKCLLVLDQAYGIPLQQ